MPARRLPALALALSLALPQATLADPWKDESGHGKGRYERGERKEEYWDGNCKVERKWEKDGEYKEERKCKGGPPPRAAYGPPPEPRYDDPVPGSVYLGSLPQAVVPGPAAGSLRCNRELIGGLLGGAAGGLLGNQVGQGRGNTAATVGGAVIGLLVGGSLGRSMDQADLACVGQALEYAATSDTVAWRDPDGGEYQVTPLRTYQDPRGAQCREYRARVTIAGRPEVATGTACRQPDGSWQRVPG